VATYTDDFNRSNGGLGANWTTTTYASAPQISSNAVVTDTAWRSAWYSANAPGNDQFAQITVSSPSFSSGGIASVSTRVDDGTSKEYEYQWAYQNGGQYRIVEWPGNTVVLNGQSAGSQGLTGTRTLLGEAVGTSLVMSVNGSEVISNGSDSTLTSGYTKITTASCAATLDDFSCGDVATFAGSAVRIANGNKVQVRDAAGDAASIRLADGSRLE
jgi:hypothetical protein